MLLAVDLYEDFINVERIAVTAVLSFQSSGANFPMTEAGNISERSTGCSRSFRAL
jgi:hypothetical protein